MNTGLLLITHGRLGQEILDTVTTILGYCPLQTETMSVPYDSDPDTVFAEAEAHCSTLEQGNGVLVLTDLYGSTPSNIANRLLGSHNVSIISGVNVPMLLRIMTYPQMDHAGLSEIAASGACNGVVVTNREQAS